jgi:FAD/FMN-containing dehydrogenase/Fe-S oxidoreductase
MKSHREQNSDWHLAGSIPRWRTELSAALGPKIRWDEVTLHLYRNAACFYDITPLAVVIPECTADIRTTVRICSIHGIPVLPRGAGSSLSGNAVGRAVILDMSHHFRDIELTGEDRVRCGVSVVLNQLQDSLRPGGKKFGPDPSSGNVCSIGGMLGNNSGGPHTMKHGNMAHHVEEVSMVLANGEPFTARNMALSDIPGLDDVHRPYYEATHRLLSKYSDAIAAERPRSTKNASGYQVWNALTPTHLNMASMMVGSEGTLGIFTGALLKILPVVHHRGIILFQLNNLVNMGHAVKLLRALGPSAIEFVDESFLQLALSFRPELREFLPEKVRYLLYVEFEGDSVSEVESLLARSKELITEKERLAEAGASSTQEDEIEKIFRVRKAATVILNRLQGKEKPVPFVEDAAIHPDVFAEFLGDLDTMLGYFPFRYAIFGHAGDGNLHLRPILNFMEPESFARAQELMERFVDLVVKHKGTLSGEHGDGRLRTQYLHRTFPRLTPLFGELKSLFDPGGILHPGIKVANPADQWSDSLRYSPRVSYVHLNARLDIEPWRTEIEKCHGCGTCREYCPVFGSTGVEESTARAKANVLRSIISGKLPTSALDADEFSTVLDYCFNCGQCITECPTAVNIPALVMLAKQKLHEKKHYKVNEFILQRGKLVSSASMLLPALSNKALRTPFVRRAMHTAVGIDARRTLPSFKRRTAFSPVDKSKEKKVVLWSGCAANFNDPEGELESAIQILDKLGYEAIMPPWACCNVAKLSYGNIDGSLDDINYNLNVLQPYVEQEIPVLFSSASCGYAFMHEYPALFPERQDLTRLAESCFDIHQFLGSILLNGKSRGTFRTSRQRVVYHAPCHLKTQQNKLGPRDLLNLVPGLELIDIRDSCCGIAGTFGMKKENFDLSMRIGSKLFEEIGRVKPDIVLSGCGTCQVQIHQGTGLDVLHPIEVLNKALVSSL